MESFWVSTGIVAVAEVGDKTQLLALILAARFKRPIPIIFGILAASLLNHGLAGALGAWITSTVEPAWLELVLGLSFIAMAIWALIPDQLEECDTKLCGQYGVLGASFVLFFLAEIGDKTQIATIALAAHYGDAIAVVLGTTLGMLIANVPVVLAGDKLLKKVPMKVLRWASAGLFLFMGLVTLVGLSTQTWL